MRTMNQNYSQYYQDKQLSVFLLWQMKDLVLPMGWRTSRICSNPPDGTNTLRKDQGGRKDPGVCESAGRRETREETGESREGP